MQVLSDLTICLREIYMPVMYFPEFNNAYASLMCYLANLGNIISQSGRISLSFIFFLLLHTKIQNGWSSNFYSIKIHLIIFLVLLGELLSHSNLDTLNSTNINRPTLYQQQQDLGQWRQKVKGLKMCKQGKKKQFQHGKTEKHLEEPTTGWAYWQDLKIPQQGCSPCKLLYSTM